MLDRTTAPPFVQAKNFFTPDNRPLVLPNGLKVFIVGGVQQEIIKIELLFPAGRWFEPAPGVAHFTTQMLEKGTATRSALELAEAFESLGAHIDIAAGPDNAEVGLYALLKNWQEAFGLLVDIVTAPSFDLEELDIMKSIYLESLKVNLAKNSFVASQVIRRNLYGGHPYGISVEEKDVTAIDVRQLSEYHRACMQPVAAFVTAPASVSQEILSKSLSVFGKANVGAGSSKPVNPGKTDDRVDKEGSVQSSLRLAKRIVTKSHPDYPHMLLLNHILGGYFGSRLMANIREEKGLTYGIHSSLNSLQRDGFFAIGADVNKDNRDLAMDEIAREIIRLGKEPIEEEEMRIATNHFLGALQLEVANPFSVTEKVKNIYLNNLPADYYQLLFDKVRSATPDELMSIANKHFQVDQLYRVSVG
jgi:zinc protease